MTNDSMPVSSSAHFADVWGDTVDLRHLACSLLLCIPLSVGTYLIASRYLPAAAQQAATARFWPLLAGLIGCLLGGAVCALAFKPKRVVVEDEPDNRSRQEVIALLAAEPGGLGRMDELPPTLIAELEQLGLRALFEEAEIKKTRAPD